MNTSLHVEADTTAVTPGTPVPVPVRVRNTGDVPMQVLVRVVGVEDAWGGPPLMVGPIEPGEATDVEFQITIPVGFPPCDHLAGIEAEPIDPTSGAPLGRAVFIEVVLEIGDGSQVRATLEPSDIHGGGRGKFRLNLRNRGRHPVNVTLEGESPGDVLSVQFAEDELVLPPGEFVRVKGKVKGSRHLLGPHRRLPFVVTIRSRGTPRHLDGSFTQSPTLKSGMMKVLALVAIVAMWGSILVIGLGKISPPKKPTLSQAAATESTTASDADGTATGGASGGGGGAGGSDAGGSTAAAAPTGTSEIRVGGKVKGSDPSGVTISLEPTSLVDENAQGANFVNDAPSNALTMHYGHTSVSAPSLIAAARTTTTDADGAWGFGGIKAPGYYLIIISKAGYATKKYVVTAPDDGSPIVLDSDLIAGDGTLGGTITGPDGPLGGVDLTITDGTVTLKTLTPTTGTIGRWSVTGLTTPGTYLVMASRRGFGDETRLVKLDAGGAVTDADLIMHAGVGSIHGTVSSITGEVGGVTVTVSDGKADHSATTLTVDPKGTYAIPQLPIPASYTLTVSGQGWITQTQQVDLEGNQTVDVGLTAANGSLSGVVKDETLPTALALNGVGITISNEQVTLKTTSATDGSGQYVQTEVPPGNYKVTFEKFGYVTQSAVVDIVSGVPATQDITMPEAPPDALTLTSKVSISVVDQRTGVALSPIVGRQDVDVSLVDEVTNVPGTPVPTDVGVAQFDGVTPGLRTFHVTATHFKSQDITVLVAPSLQRVSATAVLKRNAIVSGIVSDLSGHPIVLDASVTPVLGVVAKPVTNRTLPDVDAVMSEGGRYTFDGLLEEGTWRLVATGGDFKPNDGLSGRDPPVNVTVFAAQTIEQGITLHRLGRLQVNVKMMNAAGVAVDLDSAPNAVTTVGVGSNGVDTSTFIGTQSLTVVSTTGFFATPSLPGLVVVDAGPTSAYIRCTNLDSTHFLNCTTLHGGGVLATSDVVKVGAMVQVTGPTNPSTQFVGADSLLFTALPAGNYTATVTNGTEARTLPIGVVTDDNTTTTSLTYGALAVLVQSPSTSGVLANAVGVHVKLKLGGATKAETDTTADGLAVFTGLDATTYTVEIAGTSETPSAPITNGAVTRRGVVIASAPTDPFTGRVIWTNANGVTTGVPDAVVKVTGITSYNFAALPTAPFFSFSVVTGSISKTVEATTGNFTFSLAETSVFKFSTGDVSVVATNFVSRPVGGAPDAQLTNALISGPLTASPCPSPDTTDSCIVMSPVPGILNGEITLVGAGTDTANAVVTAQITQPTATGITLAVNAAGQLVVTDPTVSGANAIRPGTFTITYSATGYDVSPVAPQVITITPNQTSTANATFTKRAQLPVSVFCRTTAPTLPTEARATVRLTQGTDPTFTFDQTLSGASPITFTNLVAGTYNAEVSAPGCETSPTNSFSPVAGDTTGHNVQLTKLAQATGKVVSKLSEDSPAGSKTGVNGLTVTLTGSVSGNTTSVSTTTGADGSYTFGDVIGLVDDPTYTLAIDPFPTDGYTLSTANTPIPTFGVSSHADAVVPDVVLIAKKATISGKITDTTSAGAGIPGVTVRATTSLLPNGSNDVQTTTNADGFFFFTDGIGGNGPALGPVQWDFNYDVANFSHLGEQITLAPGSAPTHNVVLARQRNTIQGTTFTRFGTATAVAENGVAVEIKNVSNAADVHTTTSPTVSGGAIGSYSVTGLLNGSYFVKFTKAGYADSTVQVSVQNGQVFSQDGTIQVVPVQTTVTVRSAVTNGANNIFISGTTVTLTPKPSPAQRSPDTYTAVTDSSGVASFNQVLPSTYVVTISAVGGHLTALDVTEKTINIGDASATQTVIIQEARIFGRVLVQDTSTTPTTGTAGLTVNMYTGATAVGTPVAITTTTDTTENAVPINFLRYVASSANGYTFTFADGADHTTDSVTISNPFGATLKTVNVGTITLKKLASLTVTVQGHNAAGALVNVTDATVTVTQGGTEYDPDSPGSYSFSNLPPSVTITIEASKHHDAVPATTQTSPPSTIVAAIDARDEQGSNTITLNPGQGGVVTVTMTNCPHAGC